MSLFSNLGSDPLAKNTAVGLDAYTGCSVGGGVATVDWGSWVVVAQHVHMLAVVLMCIAPFSVSLMLRHEILLS